jgi:hypothetical protein
MSNGALAPASTLDKADHLLFRQRTQADVIAQAAGQTGRHEIDVRPAHGSRRRADAAIRGPRKKAERLEPSQGSANRCVRCRLGGSTFPW